jgi:hypothetical protein
MTVNPRLSLCNHLAGNIVKGLFSSPNPDLSPLPTQGTSVPRSIATQMVSITR